MTTETTEQHEVSAAPRRRSPLRRIGCGIALALWFLLLLTPCMVVLLASQGELVFPQGDLPEQAIRVWMIQEARLQGLGVATTSTLSIDEQTICLQTDNRFLLWRGSEEPVTYCECYRRPTRDAAWAYIAGGEGGCRPELAALEEE